MSRRRLSRSSLGVLTVGVVLACVAGLIVGFGSTRLYRSETVFTIRGFEGAATHPAELERIAADLVDIASLPSTRRQVLTEVGLPLTAQFERTAIADEEVGGVVHFAAVHRNPDTAAALSRALASVSVRVLLEGDADPAGDRLAEADAVSALRSVEDGFLLSDAGTVAASSWPALVQSAVVAGLATLMTTSALFAIRQRVRGRLAGISITLEGVSS